MYDNGKSMLFLVSGLLCFVFNRMMNDVMKDFLLLVVCCPLCSPSQSFYFLLSLLPHWVGNWLKDTRKAEWKMEERRARDKTDVLLREKSFDLFLFVPS